ncbi:HAD family hydrolase [Streptomyces sp. NPDC017056]|uniref:HAD family hydrolase n=1 Tax=Streptomyces sp. NPDC017056 TaxID=3364973 RepID=UPI00379C9466
MDALATAAFFDVDGTLTTATSMFRFLQYRMAADGLPPHRYAQERRRLRAMTALGLSRTETNRAYFTNYQGLPAAEVEELAEQWFVAELRLGGFFHPAALESLRRHAASGEVTVLVSGSFPACLTPIARYVDADFVLCSEPEIVDGRYTGHIERPMIGEEKAAAVRKLADRHRIDLHAPAAYGDHVSDLPLLRLAGASVIVGTDPEMAKHARHHGWRSLPAAPAAPSLPLPYTHSPRRLRSLHA